MCDHAEQGGLHRQFLQVGQSDKPADFRTGNNKAASMLVRIFHKCNNTGIGTDEVCLRETSHFVTHMSVRLFTLMEGSEIDQTYDPCSAACLRNWKIIKTLSVSLQHVGKRFIGVTCLEIGARGGDEADRQPFLKQPAGC